MKKGWYVVAVTAAFVAGYFVGCSDEELPAAETSRTVYEVSEANVTGNGGLISAAAVHVGTEGQGGGAMSSVAVYGSGDSGTNRWRLLVDVELAEGKVQIQPSEYPSYYYRVVVIN